MWPAPALIVCRLKFLNASWLTVERWTLNVCFFLSTPFVSFTTQPLRRSRTDRLLMRAVRGIHNFEVYHMLSLINEIRVFDAQRRIFKNESSLKGVARAPLCFGFYSHYLSPLTPNASFQLPAFCPPWTCSRTESVSSQPVYFCPCEPVWHGSSEGNLCCQWFYTSLAKTSVLYGI